MVRSRVAVGEPRGTQSSSAALLVLVQTMDDPASSAGYRTGKCSAVCQIEMNRGDSLAPNLARQPDDETHHRLSASLRRGGKDFDNHFAISCAISWLFFSSIIMWPFP